jgi:hypothetical protein
MNEPDIGQVEKRLAAVIREERREAIGYTLLTVLCTPVFVLAASLVAVLVFGYVLSSVDYNVEARGIYTGINVFLAYMLIFVLRRSNPPEEPHAFEKTWLAAVIVFLLLLILTYVAKLPERIPVPFAIVYTVLGFVVLGLLGNVQIEQPDVDEADGGNMFMSLILALSAFVAMSYGEVTRSSWLWLPPKPDEIRIAAWLLCKLVIERTTQFDARPVPRRILNMLSRLKLVQVTEHKLKLTLRGQDLIMADSETGDVVKE